MESFGAPGVKDEYVVVIKERNGTSFEIQRIVSAGGRAEKEKLVLACCGVDASLMEYREIHGFLRDNREAVTVSYVDKNDLLRLILSTGVFSGTEKPGTCGGHHQ